MRTLRTLRLCGNNITRPPREALGALQSLQNLYLNRNEMTQLKKDAFGNLLVVSKLELSGNKLWNVSYSAFENMRQMVSVDLSFNNLSWVPPGAFLGKLYGSFSLCFCHTWFFLGLVALREINLSHNRLRNLQNRTHGLFEDCLSIRKVSFQNFNPTQRKLSLFPKKSYF